MDLAFDKLLENPETTRRPVMTRQLINRIGLMIGAATIVFIPLLAIGRDELFEVTRVP